MRDVTDSPQSSVWGFSEDSWGFLRISEVYHGISPEFLTTWGFPEDSEDSPARFSSQTEENEEFWGYLRFFWGCLRFFWGLWGFPADLPQWGKCADEGIWWNPVMKGLHFPIWWNPVMKCLHFHDLMKSGYERYTFPNLTKSGHGKYAFPNLMKSGYEGVRIFWGYPTDSQGLRGFLCTRVTWGNFLHQPPPNRLWNHSLAGPESGNSMSSCPLKGFLYVQKSVS